MVWQCNHKYDGGEKCKTPVLTDDELKEKHIAAVNKLFADKDSILTDFEEILDGPLYDTSELETKRTEYEDEMARDKHLNVRSPYTFPPVRGNCSSPKIDVFTPALRLR